MRKRTRRKVYPLVDPIKLAISGAFVTEKSLIDSCRMAELSALHSFSDGSATVSDWKKFADTLNVTQTMIKMKIGAEALLTTERAEQVLFRANKRYIQGYPMSVSKTDLQILRDLYEYHDLQRTAVGRSTYEKAIMVTDGKIRGASPEVKVCVGREREAA